MTEGERVCIGMDVGYGVVVVVVMDGMGNGVVRGDGSLGAGKGKKTEKMQCRCDLG